MFSAAQKINIVKRRKIRPEVERNNRIKPRVGIKRTRIVGMMAVNQAFDVPLFPWKG